MENEDEEEWKWYEDLCVMYDGLEKIIDKLQLDTDYKTELINFRLEVFSEKDELERKWQNDLEKEGEGDVFQLIQEESYYDEIWRKENGYDI